MNVELLERICETIMQENTLFNMNAWFQKQDGTTVLPRRSDDYCGTVCCIAGHAIKLWYPNGIPNERYSGTVFTFGNWAGDILQLNPREVEKLFFVCFWPTYYQDAYMKARDIPELRAKTAVNRIQHFIKRGE